jgi:hypothetical protein
VTWTQAQGSAQAGPSGAAAAASQSGPLVTAEDVERNIMQHHSQILSTIEARNETMLRHLADSSQQQQQHEALKSLVDEQRRWVLLIDSGNGAASGSAHLLLLMHPKKDDDNDDDTCKGCVLAQRVISYLNTTVPAGFWASGACHDPPTQALVGVFFLLNTRDSKKMLEMIFLYALSGRMFFI